MAPKLFSVLAWMIISIAIPIILFAEGKKKLAHGVLAVSFALSISAGLMAFVIWGFCVIWELTTMGGTIALP